MQANTRAREEAHCRGVQQANATVAARSPAPPAALIAPPAPLPPGWGCGKGFGRALADRLGVAFSQGPGHGLLHLGAAEVATALPPLWSFWRDFAARFVTALTATPEGGEIAVTAPDALALETLCLDVPPMKGADYLVPETFLALWAQIEDAAKTELAASGGSLQGFLEAKYPAWNLVGRVYFNLAENRKDADYPFAFLATYTARLSATGAAQHLPLSQALKEFSGGKKKAELLSLLVPVRDGGRG